MKNYDAHYWRLMPFPPARVLGIGQADFREWEQTEHVTDFIRPCGLWHNLATPSVILSISLGRGKASQPFSDPEDARLRHVRRFELENNPLNRRELEVLELASLRLTNSDIAGELRIGVRTVEMHFANVYGKTGVANRRSLLATFNSAR